MLQEELHEGHVLLHTGQVERGLSQAVLEVTAGPSSEELPHLGQLSLSTGSVQGWALI